MYVFMGTENENREEWKKIMKKYNNRKKSNNLFCVCGVMVMGVVDCVSVSECCGKWIRWWI